MIDFQSIQHIVCFAAHCDDIEIGCVGSLMRIIEGRSDVHVDWVVLSGDETRRVETTRSAEYVLANVPSKNIITEPFTDTFFPEEYGSIKRFLHKQFADIQPDLVFTHHRNDAHQDHRVVCELSHSLFRGGLVLEYEIPKYDGDLGQPNTFISISAEIMAKKQKIIADFFPTQKGRYWNQPELFESIARIRGMESKSPTQFAEAFHCPKLVI